MKQLVLSIGFLMSMWGVARAQDAGTAGGACYGNGTCNAGLTCDAGVCLAPQAGTLGGACYGNATCNAGMTCDAVQQTCVAAAPTGGLAPAGATVAPTTSGLDALAPAAPPVTVAAVAPEVRQGKRWWLGAKSGLLMPGTITAEGGDYDSDAGLFSQITLDGAVAERLTLGGFVQVGQTGFEGEVDASIITLGGAIKGRFPAGKAEVRPGILLGYQKMTGEAFEGMDDSSGLDVGGVMEVAVPINQTTDFLGEVGFISQPAGGNEDAEITFGPIFYVAAGAAWGR